MGYFIKEYDAIKSPFRPGMSATVEIQTDRVSGVLTVPIQAVTTRADSTGRLKTAVEKRNENRAFIELFKIKRFPRVLVEKIIKLAY